MTSREAAIERVRAYVEATANMEDDETCAGEVTDRAYVSFNMGDLRLLLQPSEAPVTEGWRPIESAPRDGTQFLAWQIIPTEDGDTGRVTDEPSPCIAQSVFGSVGSIPLHYVPQGQRITHWRPLPPPPEQS